jgi:glycine/D-amino acid oxidase-like deaminating enzyme
MNQLPTQAKRITVVGAGIVGSIIALTLQRQGMKVTLIDKGEPGMECSYGNGGAISPDFCVPSSMPGMIKRFPKWFADPLGPLVIKWNRVPAALPWLIRWVLAGRIDKVWEASAALRALHSQSLQMYGDILQEKTTSLIETTGQLYVWKTKLASPTEELAYKIREHHGVKTEVLNEEQIRLFDPELSPGFTKGLFFPENGHTVNPLRLVKTIVELFIEIGGEVQRQKLVGFKREGDLIKLVLCESGHQINSDIVVVAAGIHSREIASQLKDFLPLEAERGYHVMLPTPGVRPKIKISNRDSMFGLAAMEDGVRISGTVEIASINAPMNQHRANALLINAKKMYPRLNTEGATFWMGSRPSTPDSIPVIDRSKYAHNLIYACGHGHTGLTGAPMTAQLVSEMIGNEKSSINLHPYKLNRFESFA